MHFLLCSTVFLRNLKGKPNSIIVESISLGIKISAICIMYLFLIMVY